MQWETVIGLEVHVQLSTQSKIFSSSSTAFGADANTQADEVDLALPGTLPVANEQAFKSAVMFGLAINADIEQSSVWATLLFLRQMLILAASFPILIVSLMIAVRDEYGI